MMRSAKPAVACVKELGGRCDIEKDVLTGFRRPLGLGQPGRTAISPYLLEPSGAPRDPPDDALVDH